MGDLEPGFVEADLVDQIVRELDSKTLVNLDSIGVKYGEVSLRGAAFRSLSRLDNMYGEPELVNHIRMIEKWGDEKCLPAVIKTKRTSLAGIVPSVVVEGCDSLVDRLIDQGLDNARLDGETVKELDLLAKEVVEQTKVLAMNLHDMVESSSVDEYGPFVVGSTEDLVEGIKFLRRFVGSNNTMWSQMDDAIFDVLYDSGLDEEVQKVFYSQLTGLFSGDENGGYTLPDAGIRTWCREGVKELHRVGVLTETFVVDYEESDRLDIIPKKALEREGIPFVKEDSGIPEAYAYSGFVAFRDGLPMIESYAFMGISESQFISLDEILAPLRYDVREDGETYTVHFLPGDRDTFNEEKVFESLRMLRAGVFGFVDQADQWQVDDETIIVGVTNPRMAIFAKRFGFLTPGLEDEKMMETVEKNGKDDTRNKILVCAKVGDLRRIKETWGAK